MDIDKLAKETILKNMTPEQQKAVLESVMASVQESKKARSVKIAENVDLVMQALKKIEAQMLARVSKATDLAETAAKNVKDGKDGRDGKDGKAGKDGAVGPKGADGRAGKDGKDGKDGRDGVDGISVVNAFLDFDNSLVIELSNGKQINVGGILADDTAEKVRVVANGGGTSQGVLDAIAALQTEITNLIPSQTGNAGKFLSTDGSNLSWVGGGGGLVYQGTWNASTNSPTLTSSVGSNGYYYVVSTAGSTNLNGITDWQIGDWAIYNGTSWQKIDNTDLVTSVNGQTGAVVIGAVPTGGTTGQILSKVNGTDYNTQWIDNYATQVKLNVKNSTGSTINKGSVVYISGATGANALISLAKADADSTSATTIGILESTLTTGSSGLVVTTGVITGLDTSAATEGDPVWLSGTTAGAMVYGAANKPNAPTHIVYLGTVTRAHAVNGEIQVMVNNGWELDELHNVSALSPSTGQTIVYNNSTGLWEKSFAPIISGTTIDNTVIGGTTPAAGTFTTLTANSTFKAGAGSTSYIQAAGGTTPYVLAQGAANASVTFGSNGTGTIFFRTQGGGSTQMAVTDTASAVNYVQVTGAATGGVPAISAQGSDSTINLNLVSKGSGVVTTSGSFSTGGSVTIGTSGNYTAGSIYSDSNWGMILRAKQASPAIADLRFANSSDLDLMRMTSTASAVNYFSLRNSATGGALSLASAGSDTNISQVFQSKGTGAIDLAAGSSGVNISNGGTVTAITKTQDGTSYTTLPTVTVSAPTTAGGTQATLQLQMYYTPSIVSGGTGYTNGDVLTIVGGTPVTSAGSITVTSVSGGVITGVVRTNFNGYTALPSNPISVTGGTGSGATFNLTWAVGAIVITNAGSGYVEQPTVSFSGGGGSGAAAYATVGSTPKITSIAGAAEVWTSSGRQLVFGAAGQNPTTVWTIYNDSFARSLLSGSGSTGISAGGTSNLSFFTNSTAQEQLRIAHTASAVNYVQVTGAATGARPIISAQGSDANITLQLSSKGTGQILLASSQLTAQSPAYIGTNSANYLILDGGATGVAPKILLAGTDTNIDLALTPKGTGKVTTTADLNAANVVASAGVYAKAPMTATYTDGIVADYTTGNGRISVGSADTLTFYNGGVASTQLAQLDVKGNLQINGGIYVNSQTISANYTIPAGSSGTSAGPITVSSGVSVTISSGSKWVVL